MAFTFQAPKGNSNNTPRQSNVDYEALNEHIFLSTTAGKKKSVPGIISGIYDLGVQNREDAEEDYNPTKTYPEGHEVYEAGGKQMVRYPRKPCRMVALAVDFPQWKVDYAQFYRGESSPTPYRMLLNNTWGVWDDAEQKKVQTVTGFPLTLMKDDAGTWGVAKNSKLHALAEATDCLDANGRFLPENLGLLLGKAAQFQVEVVLTPSKDGSKKYLNERIKLAGVIPEGLPVPELDESYIHGVNFDGANDPEMLKTVRKVVKDTIKRATNFEGSAIQQALASIESDAPKSATQPTPSRPAPTVATTPRPKPTAPSKPAPVAASWEDDDSDDSDAPF
jgi:hypothetical protein